MATLYGLKNCDTCRKARRWLSDAGIPYEFVDVREDGIDPGRLSGWVRSEGWQTLLNRRSRVWRALPESERSGLDEARAVTLMQQEPTLIKRPVLTTETGLVIGFSASRYEAALASVESEDHESANQRQST